MTRSSAKTGWPEDFDDRIAGLACACARSDGPGDSLADSDKRIRIHEGSVADAFLIRHAAQPGYAVVVWKQGHVCEPSELTAEQADCYGREVLLVGEAIQTHFSALKVNYLTLGNQTPHLHTNVVARYVDDLAPGALLDPVAPEPLPEKQWRADAATLQRLLGRDSAIIRRWSQS